MAKEQRMKLKLLSFGFKHGCPEAVNYLWDVRFLPNPYWVEDLRPKSGREHEVSEYVIGSAEGQDLIKLLKPMILFLVQQNNAAAKDELVLAVGCTGGKHRSVAVVEVLCDLLKMMPVDLICEHRDINRDD